MPTNLTELARNKWVLYGGVAVAAVAGYWFLLRPSGGDGGDGGDPLDAAYYGYPATLTPTSPFYSSSDNVGGTSDTGDGYLTALLGLESVKAQHDFDLGMAQLDVALQTSLAQISTNFDLGQQQISALNLATVGSIFESAQSSLKTTGAVAGSFQYGNEQFNFNFANFRADRPGQSMATVDYLEAFNQRADVTNVPDVTVGSFAAMPFSGAPSSTSGGNSATQITTVGRAVASEKRAARNQRRALLK